MADAQQVVDVEPGETNVGADSDSIRRQLRDSIYLWACGEKADDEDEDPTLSDGLIGWLILFMQGFAYTTLILLAGSTSSSDGDTSGESGGLLPSVTGAMYLLVASTTHDLRSGFSLLVDGSCAGHRAFGIGLLAVYGIMISAAMTVLVSTSNDIVSVVLNAVTVLFIADLDEKALKFLSTIPHKWRLFWAIESIGISFALALVAIFSIRHSSPLFEGNKIMLQTWPTWFIWMLNPMAVTISSLLLSSSLQAVCELCSESYVSVDEPTIRVVVKTAFERLLAAMKRVKERVRREPCFYFTLAIWLCQAVVTSLFFMRNIGPAVGLKFDLSGVGGYSFLISYNKLILLYPNLILATGLAAKASGAIRSRNELVTDIPETWRSSGGDGPRQEWSSCADCVDSRLSSLLVGWGIGFWVTSLLALLVCSWDGSRCGWNSAPSALRVVAYIVIPCFLLASILMVADTNFLGTRVGAFVKPAVDRMQDIRRVEYWVMVSVFRDCVVLWIGYCELLDLKYSL